MPVGERHVDFRRPLVNDPRLVAGERVWVGCRDAAEGERIESKTHVPPEIRVGVGE